MTVVAGSKKKIATFLFQVLAWSLGQWCIDRRSSLVWGTAGPTWGLFTKQNKSDRREDTSGVVG